MPPALIGFMLMLPNIITIGPAVLEAVRRSTAKPLNVCLMVIEPERYLDVLAICRGYRGLPRQCHCRNLGMSTTESIREMDRDAFKRAAAKAAVELVTQDMVVGLGSGSTAAFAIEALAQRHRQGLRFVGIPTSDRTAAQAAAADIPLTSFAEHRQIDLTIDGADEVEQSTLNLIKGLGGALLREKIVAAASNSARNRR